MQLKILIFFSKKNYLRYLWQILRENRWNVIVHFKPRIRVRLSGPLQLGGLPRLSGHSAFKGGHREHGSKDRGQRFYHRSRTWSGVGKDHTLILTLIRSPSDRDRSRSRISFRRIERERIGGRERGRRRERTLRLVGLGGRRWLRRRPLPRLEGSVDGLGSRASDPWQRSRTGWSDRMLLLGVKDRSGSAELILVLFSSENVERSSSSVVDINLRRRNDVRRLAAVQRRVEAVVSANDRVAEWGTPTKNQPSLSFAI